MSQPASTTVSPIFSTLATDPDLADLVEQYVEDSGHRLRSLRDAVELADWRRLGMLAHQIKGSAGSYGFHAVTEPASDLEVACQQELDPAEVLQAFEALKGVLARLTSGTPSS